MGILDFLSEKDNSQSKPNKVNIQPKPNMEYIYLHDMAWALDWKEIRIQRGSIVIDVTQRDNRGYDFTHKSTGERLHTNYGWSLAENTPKNVIQIEKFEKANKKLKELELKVNEILDKIITLEKQ